jgi:transposase
VAKWSQRFRATGSAAAQPVGGNRPYVLNSERDWLLKRPAEQPDVTLRALLSELAERGIKVSYYAVWHFFELKKSLYASEQDRPDVARRRMQWKKYQGRLDPARLVFIDETWAKTNMAHSRSRAARRTSGCQSSAWPLEDADLSCCPAQRLCVIDGPINGESFLAYVEQVLVPALKPGDIVIIDRPGLFLGPRRSRPLPIAATSAAWRSSRATRPASR